MIFLAGKVLRDSRSLDKNWSLEFGDWRLEFGDWRLEFRVWSVFFEGFDVGNLVHLLGIPSPKKETSRRILHTTQQIR